MELLFGSAILLSEKFPRKNYTFSAEVLSFVRVGRCRKMGKPDGMEILYPKQLPHFPACNHYQENDHG
ncbi:MAG: hypothetical protein ACOY9D_00415 [Pseudomonadota bacterium]